MLVSPSFDVVTVKCMYSVWTLTDITNRKNAYMNQRADVKRQYIVYILRRVLNVYITLKKESWKHKKYRISKETVTTI